MQYRTDTVSVLCRGLPILDEKNLKNGLRIENSAYYISRGYVPFAMIRLYKRGIFEEAFTFNELKHAFRILIVMQLIDLAGHFAFRYYT